MFRSSKKKKSGSKESPVEARSEGQKLPVVTVLVIDSFGRDWCQPDGPFPATVELPVIGGASDETQTCAVRVIQGQWKDMVVSTDCCSATLTSSVTIHLAAHRDSNQPDRDPSKARAQVSPDVVLVRQLVRQLPVRLHFLSCVCKD